MLNFRSRDAWNVARAGIGKGFSQEGLRDYHRITKSLMDATVDDGGMRARNETY